MVFVVLFAQEEVKDHPHDHTQQHGDDVPLSGRGDAPQGGVLEGMEEAEDEPEDEDAHQLVEGTAVSQQGAVPPLPGETPVDQFPRGRGGHGRRGPQEEGGLGGVGGLEAQKMGACEHPAADSVDQAKGDASLNRGEGEGATAAVEHGSEVELEAVDQSGPTDGQADERGQLVEHVGADQALPGDLSSQEGGYEHGQLGAYEHPQQDVLSTRGIEEAGLETAEHEVGQQGGHDDQGEQCENGEHGGCYRGGRKARSPRCTWS